MERGLESDSVPGSAVVRMPEGEVRVGLVMLHGASAAREPWFEHAYLPSEPPPEDGTWSDMDFDPIHAFREVHVPVLTMWGTDEECVPRHRSRDAWQSSGASVTLVDLPECGHWPVAGSATPGYAGWEGDDLSEDFTASIAKWLDNLLSATAGRNPGPRG